MFLGKQINKFDQRNRIFVPARFKDALGSEFVITVLGDKNCIQCYTLDEFTNKYLDIQNRIGDMIDEDSLLMDLFSDATTVNVDSQGRITIPDDLHSAVGLGSEALILGMGNHVEIWNEEAYAEYRGQSKKAVQMVKDAENLTREANIAKRMRDAAALKNPTEG